jgi:hypothetical protein
MGNSGTFRSEQRGLSDRYRSTDYRRDLPREDKSPLRVTQHEWRLEDGTPVKLKEENFYFPFENRGQHEHYDRYTLTVGDVVISIDRVENSYSLDGTIGPETVTLLTADGNLVMNHVRILDNEGWGTDKFKDSATWCERELTSVV